MRDTNTPALSNQQIIMQTRYAGSLILALFGLMSFFFFFFEEEG